MIREFDVVGLRPVSAVEQGDFINAEFRGRNSQSPYDQRDEPCDRAGPRHLKVPSSEALAVASVVPLHAPPPERPADGLALHLNSLFGLRTSPGRTGGCAGSFPLRLRLLVGHKPIPGVVDLSFGIKVEMFDEGSAALPFLADARVQIDRQVGELFLRAWRWWRKRSARRIVRPDRLDDGLEDRQCYPGAGLAVAQGAMLFVRIVVADPCRHRDIVGEADEPAVI